MANKVQQDIDDLATDLAGQQKFLSRAEKRDLLLTLSMAQIARALTRLAVHQENK
jgi:hypothetical protein